MVRLGNEHGTNRREGFEVLFSVLKRLSVHGLRE
jgi:hypothetical protein